jgi:hypothetical protein
MDIDEKLLGRLLLQIDKRDGWATEKTLRDLVDAMGGKRSRDDRAAKNKDISREKATKTIFDSLRNDSVEFGRSVNNTLDNLGNFDNVARSVTRTVSDMGDAVGDTLGKIPLIGSLLGATVGLVVGAMTDVFDEMVASRNTYRDMINVGQSFGGNIIAMGQAAYHANMSIDQFAQTINEASEAAATLGGKGLSDYFSTMTSVMAKVENFGMTLGDVQKHYTQHIKMLKQTGKLETMSAKDAAESFKDLVQNADMLARITGRSRDDILRGSMTKSNDDSGWKLSMSMRGQGSQQELMKLYQNMSAQAGKGAADSIMDAFVKNGSVWFSDLASNAGLGLQNTLDTIQNQLNTANSGGKTDPEAITKALMADLGNMSEAQIQILNQMASDGDAQSKMVMDVLAHARESANQKPESFEEEMKRRTGFTRTLLQADQALSTLRANFKSFAFDLFDKGAKFLGPAWDTIADIMKEINTLGTDSEQWTKKFESIFERLRAAALEAWDYLWGKVAELAGGDGTLAEIAKWLLKTKESLSNWSLGGEIEKWQSSLESLRQAIDSVAGFVNGVTNSYASAKSTVSNAWNTTTGAIGSAWDSVTGIFGSSGPAQTPTTVTSPNNNQNMGGKDQPIAVMSEQQKSELQKQADAQTAHRNETIEILKAQLEQQRVMMEELKKQNERLEDTLRHTKDMADNTGRIAVQTA